MEFLLRWVVGVCSLLGLTVFPGVRMWSETCPTTAPPFLGNAAVTIRDTSAYKLFLRRANRAGARLARELGLTVSPDTLLRRLRQASQKESATPRVIGVDDFAFRRRVERRL